MGAGFPPKGGILHPLAQSRRGGGRDGTWGGRGSARRQATYKRGDARHGGASARRGDDWGCNGGHTGGATTFTEPPRKRKRGFSTLR
jgi:hypothetical protein